jgi:ParB family chromosome partitioning protein
MTTGTFEVVAIARLRESATNPRRHFGKAGMAELAASIREHGVLNPLLVRPAGDSPPLDSARGKQRRRGRKEAAGGTAKATADSADGADGTAGVLEVVCGARRLRAAKAAGLERLPVRIEQLSDRAVLEIQVIENLQREDVHPLDEALGYRQLMQADPRVHDHAGGSHLARYTVPELALRVGKSESYVYQRMKLTDLIEAGQKAFWAEKIGLGHALLIARLGPEQQAEALKEVSYEDGMSAADLERWIREEILLELSAAPWRKDDPAVVPAAGTCNACAKRSGATPALFPEVGKKDLCIDPKCYQAKREAHIAGRIAEAKQNGQELVRVMHRYGYRDDGTPAGVLGNGKFTIVDKAKPCPHARAGIVVYGDRDVGQRLLVCIEPKCKQHGHQIGGGGGAYKPSAAELRRKEEERQGRVILKRTKEQLELCLDARQPAGEQVGGADLYLLAAHVVEHLGWGGAKEWCERLGVKCSAGFQGADQPKVALFRHICESEEPATAKAELVVGMARQGMLDDYVPVLAGRYGVDVAAIAAEVEAKAEAAAAKRESKTASHRKDAKKGRKGGKR